MQATWCKLAGLIGCQRWCKLADDTSLRKLSPQGCNVPNLTMRKLAELLVIMVAGIIAGERWCKLAVRACGASLRREHVVQACSASLQC